MVSEFIEEKDGYLALSKSSRSLPLQFWRLVSIETREGYWNSDRFMEQVGKAVKIADVKYPPSQGYHHVLCFDHSCGHTAFAEDVKQLKMRDEWTTTNYDST